MIRLAVAGAGGRMGRQVLAAALVDPVFTLAGGIVRGGSPLAGHDLGILAGLPPAGVAASEEGVAGAELAGADILVNFTVSATTPRFAAAAAAHSCAFLAVMSVLVTV